MKRTSLFALFLAFVLNSVAAQSLFIGNPVTLSNYNYFATFQTGTVSVTFPQVTASLSSVTNTNSLFIGSYVFSLNNAAGSNIVYIQSLTNAFVVTNNTNIVIPAQTYSLPIYFQYSTLINSNYTMGLQVH